VRTSRLQEIAVLTAAILSLAPLPVAAGTLLLNPFLSAAAYRAEREASPEATMRVRFESTTTGSGEEEPTTELVVDVAEDWALLRRAGEVTLFDFLLLRRFALDEEKKTFVGLNLNGDVTFRVMERQNRIFIQKMIESIETTVPAGDECDAETELGIVLPGQHAAVEVSHEGRVVTATCKGRTISVLELGAGASAPKALWPTLTSVVSMHPTLSAEGTLNGAPPESITTTFQQVGPAVTRSWRLVSIESVVSAYPLTDAYENATEQWLAGQLPEGIAALAGDVVTGKAAGGPPTFESWNAHLGQLARTDPVAATLAILPTAAMFPERMGGCPADTSLAICTLLAGLRDVAALDPAVGAQFAIASAEQSGDSALALRAMLAAQGSKHRDHPALGQAFALALIRFGQEFQQAAGQQNLPTDPWRLMHSTLGAYPYNSAYWTDLGDLHGRQYEYPTALLLYDIAYSLPMPSAGADNPILQGKLAQMARIKVDFPHFYLPE
jgi:hypothetical protein